MSRVPRIRFKGFKEDWEQRKLGEVFEEYSEKNRSELPPLTIIQGGGTIRRDESDRALQYDKGSLSNYKVVNKGDFIVHLRSFEGGLEKANSTGIVSPAYHTLSGENTDTTFYYAYFRSRKFIESDLKPHVYGIRDGRSIDIEGMKTINIPYTIFDEQRRIGKFIDLIDHLITLHQRKFEKLKIIKKSMLITLHQSKSFEYIFKAIVNCTLYWEQRKLGEYLIQYTEVTIINDQYPVLTSSRKGIFFQKDYYDGNQIASENNIGYNIVPYGYFTYRHMSDDEIFYFNINNIIDNGIVSTLYPVFTTNNRLDSKFLQYELNFGKEFRKYSVLQKQGGSRTYMYFNKLRDLKLTITTSLKEQECIRNLICSIDHLITLHQSKLEKLQKIKKSMLESMFV